MSEHPMDRYLERYLPPDDLDKVRENGEQTRSGRTSPRNVPIDATLDLHGYRLSEARVRLGEFLGECLAQGARKVLIVHGKGSHGSGVGRIRQMVREELENNGFVGATGHPAARNGGTGATWAMLRRRDQRSR